LLPILLAPKMNEINIDTLQIIRTIVCV